MPDHRIPQARRQGVEPASVDRGGYPGRRGRELLLAEPFHVVPAGCDQRVDEGVPVGERCGSVLTIRRHRFGISQVVTGRAQRVQQPDRGRRGVQADGVTDPGVLRRVRRQHQRDLLLAGRDVSQPGQARGDPGEPGRAFGVGRVHRHSVRTGFLERERHGDDPAVELGDRDLHGRVHRCHARVARRPLRTRRGQAQPLHHGYVQGGECTDVPRLVIPACGRIRRSGATGGEHGHHQRVDPGEQTQDAVNPAGCIQVACIQAAQGRGEHRVGIGPAGLQRVAQCVHERGVAGRGVRPVEHDPDRWTVGPAHPRAVHPGGGHRRGRRETEPGEQQGVGKEAVQLGEVRGAALSQVSQRCRGNTGRYGGTSHEFGVGHRFPAEHHRRAARGERRGQPVRPGPHPPEQPDDHHGRAVEQRGDVLGGAVGGGKPGRVGHPPRHPAGTSGQ